MAFTSTASPSPYKSDVENIIALTAGLTLLYLVFKVIRALTRLIKGQRTENATAARDAIKNPSITNMKARQDILRDCRSPQPIELHENSLEELDHHLSLLEDRLEKFAQFTDAQFKERKTATAPKAPSKIKKWAIRAMCAFVLVSLILHNNNELGKQQAIQRMKNELRINQLYQEHPDELQWPVCS